jgi:DNA repair protein RAD16
MSDDEESVSEFEISEESSQESLTNSSEDEQEETLQRNVERSGNAAVSVQENKAVQQSNALTVADGPRKPKVKKPEKIDFFSLHPDLQNVWNLNDSQPTLLPQATQPPRMNVKLLPFQLQGLHWMHERERTANGGILADEMVTTI